MAGAGFAGWDRDRLARTVRMVLPEGFFVIEHRATARLVATAMACHRPSERHPYGAELGWVAGDADHKGKGLGLAVCAAATGRLIRAGCRNIYLLTDDWRLAAIKTCLKLGFRPLPHAEGMADRWRKVCEKPAWNRR
jgi:mycothiol synthase